MRLTEDQVRSKLDHPNQNVRAFALAYFGRAYHRDPAIAEQVVAVAERLGPAESFGSLYPLSNLVQTADTVAWAIRQLEKPELAEPAWPVAKPLGLLLARTDPALVVPYRERLASLPGLSKKHVKRLLRRLELATWPADRLWRRLDEICKLGKNKEFRDELPFTEAREITSMLARDPAEAPRMMELLPLETDFQKGTHWRQRFLVRMAGEMRYEPAVEVLVRVWRKNSGWLLGTASLALTKIGTDTAVDAVAKAYHRADAEFREDAAEVFGNIRSDLAVEAGLAMLKRERDILCRDWLIFALVEQFSTEAVDAAAESLRERPYCRYQLMEILVTVCELMEYEIPDVKIWKEELANPEEFDDDDGEWPDDDSEPDDEEEEANEGRSFDEDDPEHDPADFDSADYDPDAAPLTRAAPVGRNDPCPCGSGKKYKKCCMREQQLP
jgi:hypothetical protein